MSTSSISQRVRNIVQETAQLDIALVELHCNTNLYDAGLTSHASARIMFSLESEFGIEFPDEILTRDMFNDISTISRAVESLLIDSRCS